MRRRDFLKAPAYGLALGSSVGLAQESTTAQPLHNAQQGQAPQAEVQQRMHPDFITFIPGVEYFLIGNGRIQGVVQFSPKDPESSYFGLTIMNPERFCRKWSTFLYHPERGFTNTKLGITINEEQSGPDAKSGMFTGVKGYALTRENFKSIEWKYPKNVPVVSLRWTAGECEIEEEFFSPHTGALLFRRVTVKNPASKRLSVGLGLSLYANFGLFDEIAVQEKEKTAHAIGVERITLSALAEEVSVAGRYNVQVNLGLLNAGEAKQAVYVYALHGEERLLKKTSFKVIWKKTAAYWSGKNVISTHHKLLDSLLNISKASMYGVVAQSGKMDAGWWMYNMEWVSDQALAIEALLHCGMKEQARTMLERNLQSAIGPDGRTIESSRWFGYEYTELNQNGMLLYALWVYYCYTGDEELVRKHWSSIKRCADFPLLEVFRDPATKMVKNKREFWERSDPHGVEEGYEMAYQFWVSFGLEKAAEVAQALGKIEEAKRWRRASAETKESMLKNPRFKLVEDGHLIKRRKATGEWQQYFIPPDRKRMPANSPLAVEGRPSAEPDVIEIYPIIYDFIDPKGDLAQNTLRWVEQLWNHRWEGGGYPRYNSTSEDNPPAPWPLASMLVARAYARAGDDEKVWRVLQWLASIHGGKSGGWFERYGQSITPPMPPVNVVGWTWYEILALAVRDVIGLQPQTDHIMIQPHMLAGLNEISAQLTVRTSKLHILLRRTTEKNLALVNGKEVEFKNGILKIQYSQQRKINIELSLTV
ncbi:MAG: hypothetical protein V1799_17020 [bacterium]